ncbi:MAG TPA: TatD family hydrolase, partial [Patescibacteria group bacterium]|nr:TatD family hydrolase [Patescibacteria group bacterium]
MKYIDTHTHVNLRAFRDDSEAAIQRALDAGVAVVNVGTQIDTSRQAVSLLEKFPNDEVYAVIGLHPVHTYSHDYEDEEEVKFKTREETFDPALYAELVKHERVVGIGEC